MSEKSRCPVIFRLSKVWTGPQMSGSRSRYGWTWTLIIGPGPAGEWTGPGQNFVVNSPKKSLQNKPKNIFFGQLLTKIWTK